MSEKVRRPKSEVWSLDLRVRNPRVWSWKLRVGGEVFDFGLRAPGSGLMGTNFALETRQRPMLICLTTGCYSVPRVCRLCELPIDY